MLRIGEFSKLSRISIRMLRYYDEIGLLTPETTDAFTGYRYYSAAQLTTADHIAALRALGFSLAETGELLCCGSREAMERALLERRKEARQDAEAARQRLVLLETAIERLRKDEPMMQYHVVLKTIPQRSVASVRQVLPDYAQEGRLWQVFCQETDAMNLRFPSPAWCAAVFHDGEYRERDVDVEIQMAVQGDYPDTEHVRFKTAESVTVASATYQGDYQQIGAVNAAVAAWVESNGYEFAGPMFNIYHVGPADTQDSARFVTEVCYPVSRGQA